MRVLIVGSGGREHALAAAVVSSPRLTELFVAPGNPGTATLGRNVRVAVDDIDGIVKFVDQNSIELTIVGPEDPLCAGLADRVVAAGSKVFGPSAAAARIEGDKAFAKQLMRRAAVPTAEGRAFDDYHAAYDYVATRDTPVVIKAAGLARGKGVVVCDEPSNGLLALEKFMVDRIFGAAGDVVVVEEKLVGPEVSVHALVDGRSIYLLDTAQDYKRARVGDAGPNTGGMGACSPAPSITAPAMDMIVRDILVPVVDTMCRDEVPYRGVLYAGLMLTAGGPKVLEFNCRFGDPEAQVILPRLRSDFLTVAEAVADGRLDTIELEWDQRTAVCVVLASAGYPESYDRDVPISGLDAAAGHEAVHVFHAGTADRGGVLTSGGRVLGITALGNDRAEARGRAYAAAADVRFEGMQFRTDIAAE